MDVIHFRRNADGTFDQHAGIHGWQPVLDTAELFGLEEIVDQRRAVDWFKGGGVVMVVTLAVLAVFGMSKP